MNVIYTYIYVIVAIKPELQTLHHKKNQESDSTKQINPNSAQPMDQLVEVRSTTLYQSQTDQ